MSHQSGRGWVKRHCKRHPGNPAPVRVSSHCIPTGKPWLGQATWYHHRSAWRYGKRAAGSRDQKERQSNRQRTCLCPSLSSKRMYCRRWKSFLITLTYKTYLYVSQHTASALLSTLQHIKCAMKNVTPLIKNTYPQQNQKILFKSLCFLGNFLLFDNWWQWKTLAVGPRQVFCWFFLREFSNYRLDLNLVAQHHWIAAETFYCTVNKPQLWDMKKYEEKMPFVALIKVQQQSDNQGITISYGKFTDYCLYLLNF